MKKIFSTLIIMSLYAIMSNTVQAAEETVPASETKSASVSKVVTDIMSYADEKFMLLMKDIRPEFINFNRFKLTVTEKNQQTVNVPEVDMKAENKTVETEQDAKSSVSSILPVNNSINMLLKNAEKLNPSFIIKLNDYNKKREIEVTQAKYESDTEDVDNDDFKKETEMFDKYEQKPQPLFTVKLNSYKKNNTKENN